MLENLYTQFISALSFTLKALAPVVKRFAELGVMIFGCWLTWKGLEWSFTYADKAIAVAGSTENGVALVIGAVLGPLLTFTGVIVKLYLTHSNGNGNGNGFNGNGENGKP